MSLYTQEVKQAVHSVDKPVPVAVHVVEFSDHLRLRVYENEVMRLGNDDRVRIMSFLSLAVEVIKSFGIDCFPEGVKGDPQ